MSPGKKSQKFRYRKNNQELSSVEEEKDLGVYANSDLKPSRQCLQAYFKTTTFGMIRQTITCKRKEVFLRL